MGQGKPWSRSQGKRYLYGWPWRCGRRVRCTFPAKVFRLSGISEFFVRDSTGRLANGATRRDLHGFGLAAGQKRDNTFLRRPRVTNWRSAWTAPFQQGFLRFHCVLIDQQEEFQHELHSHGFPHWSFASHGHSTAWQQPRTRPAAAAAKDLARCGIGRN